MRDVRVLATLGARTVPIYSLETTVRRSGPGMVRELAAAARRPFTGAEAATATADSPQALADRALLRALDLAAAASTPLITRDSPGGAQRPNAYPDGCGELRG